MTDMCRKSAYEVALSFFESSFLVCFAVSSGKLRLPEHLECALTSRSSRLPSASLGLSFNVILLKAFETNAYLFLSAKLPAGLRLSCPLCGNAGTR